MAIQVNGIDNAGYYGYLKRYAVDGGFWYLNGTSGSNGGSVSEITPLANSLLTWEKGKNSMLVSMWLC